MADIPTIPGTMVVNTPDAGVHADFDSLNAGNRGARSAALAMGEVGQELGTFAQKLQRTVNYSTAADFDRTMRETASKFHEDRINRPDEGNWDKEWQDTADNTLNTFLSNNPGLGPDIRRQMRMNWADWKSSNGIQVNVMANHQRLSRAMDKVDNDAEVAAQSGDMDHAAPYIQTLYDGAVKNHTFLPEVADQKKRVYTEKVAEYGIRNMMMQAPWLAPDYLTATVKDKSGEDVTDKDGNVQYANLKGLSPTKREELLNTSRVQFTKFQESNLQGLIGDLQNGNVATPDVLSDLVTKKVITPKMRMSYEGAYRKGNFNTDPVEIGKLFTDLNNYDQDNDPKSMSRAKLLGRIATGGYPQNVQAEMNKLIEAKSDPASALNTTVAKDAMQAIDQRFKLGLYGKYEDRVLDPGSGLWSTTVHPEIYETAMATKSKIEDGTRKFLNDFRAKNKRDATSEEVNGFISNMQQTSTTKAGVAPLMETTGWNFPRLNETPNQKKARLDAILSKNK